MPQEFFPIEETSVRLFRTSIRRAVSSRILLLGILVAPAPYGDAQLRSLANASSTTSVKLSGQVVNAVNGSPISRALVRFNSRAILTDQEGKFQFDQVTDAAGNFQVVKPGYSLSNDPLEQPNLFFQFSQITEPLVFRLYPESILTGTVTAPDGQPLAHVGVTTRRSTFDDLGSRWMVTGQVQTDLHGEFRIPVNAGDYRIETAFTRRNDGSREAVLPVALPTPAPGASQVIHVRSGEEQRFDLRPPVRRIYPVPITIESTSERGFPSIRARSNDGTSFNVQVSPTRTAGRGTLLLPAGTYKLTSQLQSQDSLETAETSITVTGAETATPDDQPLGGAGAVLRFVATSSIPVELSIDSSSTSDNSNQRTGGNSASSIRMGGTNSQPTPLQFGLSLLRVEAEGQEEDGGLRSSVPLASPRNGVPSFNISPGSYRLLARGNGPWYIKSASYGTSDLLAQGLTVTPGSSSAPIRLVVSNQTGSLEASVTLLDSPAKSCWVYLVATGPSVVPISNLRCNGTNSKIESPFLAPGTYQAVAFEHRHPVDLTNPANLALYATHVKSVVITVGGQTTLSLSAVPESEEKP
ncbi:MAG: carboxypeptidase regulatory-like protein [Acidobacteriaceae bacterium]|nr:carboxypeptidase regulatory-like protein [Acidobacteriaceae bacterium]